MTTVDWPAAAPSPQTTIYSMSQIGTMSSIRYLLLIFAIVLNFPEANWVLTFYRYVERTIKLDWLWVTLKAARITPTLRIDWRRLALRLESFNARVGHTLHTFPVPRCTGDGRGDVVVESIYTRPVSIKSGRETQSPLQWRRLVFRPTLTGSI